MSKKNNVIGGFVGGPEGLRIRLMEGAPPSVIQDSSTTPFSFIISIENAGEAPVGPGTDNPLILARLGGVVLSDFGLTRQSSVKQLNEKLEPAKRNYDDTTTPGEINYIGFEDLLYKREVADSEALTLRAELCYDYETYVSAKFCMKKDILEMPEDSTICVLRGDKPFGNSGGPLQVTRVEEAPINSNTVQINFNIEHVGKGFFFYRNTPKDLYDACVFNDADPNIYKLEVSVEPVQKELYSLDCQRLSNIGSGALAPPAAREAETGTVSGVIRMVDGAPLSISCFLSRTKPMENRVYEDMLSIRLRYRYGEFIEQPMLIQHRTGGSSLPGTVSKK
jgi:hypothetical protein